MDQRHFKGFAKDSLRFEIHRCLENFHRGLKTPVEDLTVMFVEEVENRLLHLNGNVLFMAGVVHHSIYNSKKARLSFLNKFDLSLLVCEPSKILKRVNER